jgi:hypothetical protein
MQQSERPMRRARIAGALALALVVFVVTFGLAGLARAQDVNGVVGTRHGCVDATIGMSWTELTSASLESSTGSAALASGLYWTEILIKEPTDSVYLCLAGASACGANTTNKLKVSSGGTLALPVTGLSLQAISLYGTSGSPTLQVCGFFRVHP